MTADAAGELRELRDDIDEVDERIAALVVERLELAEAVAAVKAASGSGLVDEDREDVVEDRYADAFAAAGVDPGRGEDLARLLIEASLARERQVE